MSESIAANLGQSEPAPVAAGTIGCVCANEEIVSAVVDGLLRSGVTPAAIHLGATDASRAEAAAQKNGVRADVSPDDPLQGLAQLGGEGAARQAVDRGGLIGAVVGIIAGFVLSFTPFGSLIPVPHQAQTLANCLLFFVVGTISGSVLGAAFAPQQSAHAGFRLIDGMADGGFALVAIIPRAQLDELQKVLESGGATGITRV